MAAVTFFSIDLMLFLILVYSYFIWLMPREHLKYCICDGNCFIYNPLMFTQHFRHIVCFIFYLNLSNVYYLYCSFNDITCKAL